MALFAVHISDGVLSVPLWLAGFVAMTALAWLGARRVRDDEVPRIAVLTSAFFVVSLIHVPVGPVRAHLLLNGLMGVVLGWRAAVAIPIAVSLQAVLFGHGGFTTIGINSCVMTLPALAAGYLFAFCRCRSWFQKEVVSAAMVGVACFFWIISLLFCLGLLGDNALLLMTSDVQTNDGIDASGAVADMLAHARQFILRPGMLSMALGCATLAAFIGHRSRTRPEFTLGLLVGSLSVLATVALNCGVLVVGGETLIEVAGRVVPVNWTLPVAALMLLIHLPLAIVEGLVLGFTINLLARVRPDLLRGAAVRPAAAEGTGAATPAALEPQYSSPAGSTALGSPALLDAKRLIAILAVLLTVTPSARAHRLDADYKVLSGQVRIEGWFDIGDEPPAGAVVQVTHENGMTVVEGKLDEKGTFTFKFRRAENLRIVISAGAGHRKELRISAAELARSVDSNHSMPAKVQTGAATSERRRSLLDLLMRTALGIGIIASAATFALAWLRRAGSPAMAPEASPHPVALPTAPNLH